MIFNKKEIKNIQLTNFTETIQTSQAKELLKKRKENEEYIAYIKEHDTKAYENYLSYSTYLNF